MQTQNKRRTMPNTFCVSEAIPDKLTILFLLKVLHVDMINGFWSID